MSSAGGSGVRAKFVDQPTDLADLRKLLEDARGRLVSARRGVGDEVLLRIRPLRGGGGGDCRVGTQASDWVLASPSSVLAGARASSAVLNAALSELEQIEVSRLEVTDSLALVVVLADGRWLEVQGYVDDPEEREDDPPYWEVLTPSNELLRAGPGPIWLRSDRSVQPLAPSSRPALDELAVDDLLTMWSSVTVELSRRGVETVSHSGLADLAEELVRKHFRGFRNSYERAGWDVRSAAGERIAVEAIRQPHENRWPPISVHDGDFDALVVVVFDDKLAFRKAWHVPRDAVLLHLRAAPSRRARVPLGHVLDDPSVKELRLA